MCFYYYYFLIGRPSNTLTSKPAGANAGSGNVGAASAVDDEQLQLIYQQLDEKDDEINKQSQNIIYLRQNMEQQDKLIDTITKERDSHFSELTRLQV